MYIEYSFLFSENMNSLVIIVLFCIGLGIMFQQNDYKVQHHHLELAYYNRTFLDHVRIYNVKPNRTYRAYSGFFELLIRMDSNDLKLNIEVEAILNNVPKLRIIQYDMMCQILEKDIAVVKGLLKSSNLTKCPVKKGFYGVRNYNVDDKHLPPNVPQGSYRVTLTFWIKHSMIAKLYIFGKVIYGLTST